ncbi:MAG: DinB family protein [Caldilineaceae bacterium]|nr:DinB family protein [Caldilineaceae bacterium]
MAPNAVLRMFDYNEWAWQRIFPSLAALPAEEYCAERPFFWHSLHGLAVHSFGADWIWLQRCQGVSPSALPAMESVADLADLRRRWDPVRAEFRAYVAGLGGAQLAAEITYRDTAGKPYSFSLDDLLRHVMNHATEHRSQMTPTLFQLGHPTEPLDYLYFARRSAQ